MVDQLEVENNVGEDKPVSFEEEVETFLINLHDFVYHRNADAIKKLFDTDFYTISDIYFKNTRWPSIKLVDNFYKQKNRFHNLIHSLYEELYYRHVFIINDVNLEDRKNAWDNYKCLLNFISSICTDMSGDTNDNVLVMPNVWIYEFLSEYVYQYQSMCHIKVDLLKDVENNIEGINFLVQNCEVFESSIVLEVLHSLLLKGEFATLPEEEKSIFVNNVFNVNNEELTSKYQFAYFSCCILLKVYVLMGDYYSALKIISNIELNHKSLYWKVTLCHISIFYNIAFCYMMLKRYNDSIKILSQILIYLSKQKIHFSNHQRYQQNVIHKLIDKMYLIVIICHSLSSCRLDETILQNIKENYSSKFYALQSANEQTYADLFYRVAPKFIDPLSNISFQLLANFENVQNQTYNSDPTLRQLCIFLKDVTYQKKTFHFISYAKLYHNIQLTKLADLMNYKKEDEENVCSDIMCVKNHSKQLIWKEGPLYTGEMVTSVFGNAFDFYIDLDILNIKTRTQQKIFIDYFVHQINMCKNLSNVLQGTGTGHIYKTKYENFKRKNKNKNRDKHNNPQVSVKQ
ncbi:eukaryotic translation initiation factor 3 subunit L [Plasmodium brasilianum]|uniref:Eukaryotic translation initiation factor 3 subunit L n=2 Tax=Plasmodium (Plasmodium) TaxID=418103 RepID=A0A1A8W3I7_PLAMA|nr:eukaryotic translation initiation factor 3 subunit L, putative [Plasmodium malariae]KAI4837373.1 eukaryotic translation initiation factor 3 subunit L [Plasmodium brasilianum]SBS87341.1 eukaryotic translation initiation factor 3 subunit 6 interacting protein, putative [Plasmodium malariae]SCO93257.1 eukaryotic translation initiation factor 3 subunit L, putative [Plasmodium malariae]